MQAHTLDQTTGARLRKGRSALLAVLAAAVVASSIVGCVALGGRSTPAPAPLPSGPAAAQPGASPATQSADRRSAGTAVVLARANPFLPNRDLQRVIDSEPPHVMPAEPLAASHALWREVRSTRSVADAGDESIESAGPAVPPMRVAGILYGDRMAAVMQIDGEMVQVLPGRSVPERLPVYRVERIELDRVFLTRRWQSRRRSGVQRLEVGMAGGAPVSM